MNLRLLVQMETETQLVADPIALNEKKVAMALGWFMSYLYAILLAFSFVCCSHDNISISSWFR